MTRKNFFEKNPKLVLLIVNFCFIAILAMIVQINVFQDSPSSTKYSLLDLIRYNIQCQGKRNINLRENKPNSLMFKLSPYEAGKKYRFQVDEEGFVMPSKIHDNPDLNVVFLGGSTTECEYVEEEFRFPYLVGRILEEKTGKKINSYNSGKSGNNSIHSINNLINKVAPLKPKIVVRMENINDLSTLLYEASFWNKNKSRSNISCFSKKITNLRSFKNEWQDSPYRDKITDEKHRELIRNEFRKILKLFIYSTRGIEAVPVLMTQFNRIENDPKFSVSTEDEEFNKAYRKLYSDLNEITRKVAKDENVLLIDLANLIPGEKDYIYDSVHLTKKGSVLSAQIISEKLLKQIR